MNWIEVPYGLVLCRADGEAYSVTAVHPEGLRLRTDRELSGQTLETGFLRLRKGHYGWLKPEKWRIQAVRRENGALYYDIAVEEGAFRREMQAALRDFGGLIRDREEMDETELAEKYTGCAAGGEIQESLLAQKRKWFSAAGGPYARGEWELALSLDHPGKCEAYLNMDKDAFQRHFLAESGLDGYALFERPATRLYVGNAWCHRLCPDGDILAAIRQKAAGDGLEISLVLPGVGRMEVPEDFWGEIVVNDLGAVRRLRGRRLVLGTMLNRRRKDPRLGSASENGDSNALNDPVWLAWLREMGVERIEYESGGRVARLAQGKCSLHLPFYQTNTGHDCVLSAACRGLDAGVGHGECRRECMEYALMYPDGMRLIGRYNSLFAADTQILQQQEMLQNWLDQGVDRLVAEVL